MSDDQKPGDGRGNGGPILAALMEVKNGLSAIEAYYEEGIRLSLTLPPEEAEMQGVELLAKSIEACNAALTQARHAIVEYREARQRTEARPSRAAPAASSGVGTVVHFPSRPAPSGE